MRLFGKELGYHPWSTRQLFESEKIGKDSQFARGVSSNFKQNPTGFVSQGRKGVIIRGLAEHVGEVA